MAFPVFHGGRYVLSSRHRATTAIRRRDWRRHRSFRDATSRRRPLCREALSDCLQLPLPLRISFGELHFERFERIEHDLGDD